MMDGLAAVIDLTSVSQCVIFAGPFHAIEFDSYLRRVVVSRAIRTEFDRCVVQWNNVISER